MHGTDQGNMVSCGQIPSPDLLSLSHSGQVSPAKSHPSPLKRSMSLIPTGPRPGEWRSPRGLGARGCFLTPDHAPLSPQSSVASSGSEQTEEQGSSEHFPGGRQWHERYGWGLALGPPQEACAELKRTEESLEHHPSPPNSSSPRPHPEKGIQV